MVAEASTLNIDQTDLALLKELEADARQSTYQLAKKVGISASTVKPRLRRLERDGIIKWTVRSHPLILGYQTFATLGINVRPGSGFAIAGQIESHECVLRATVNSGRYDIMAYVSFPSSEELYTFVTGTLGSMQGILDVETMPMIRVIKQSWALLGRDQLYSFNLHRQNEVDAQDLRMIRELEANPRHTINVLAEKLGVTRQTASARLQRLLDTGLVRVVAVVDPSVLGYSVWASIMVKVHPSKIPVVADTLALDRRIRNLIISTGRYDIITSAMFKNTEEMGSFLSLEMATIPGIQSHESMILLRELTPALPKTRLMDTEQDNIK